VDSILVPFIFKTLDENFHLTVIFNSVLLNHNFEVDINFKDGLLDSDSNLRSVFFNFEMSISIDLKFSVNDKFKIVFHVGFNFCIKIDLDLSLN
jgi:hypothetical protein